MKTAYSFPEYLGILKAIEHMHESARNSFKNHNLMTQICDKKYNDNARINEDPIPLHDNGE